MDELYEGLVLTFRGLEVGAGIDDRDIHRLADLPSRSPLQ
jgi:hypothetical protein